MGSIIYPPEIRGRPWPSMASTAKAFSPLDIAGLQLWVTAGITFAPNQWSDRSGLNHHFLQPTPTNQPTTDTDPGFAEVNFNGIQTWMAASFALAQPETIVICVAPQQSGVGTSPFDGISILTMALYHASSTAHTMFAQGAATSGSQNVASIADGVFRVWSFQYAGTSSFMRQNGTQSASGLINLTEGSSPANGMTLGGLGNHGAQFKMAVAEICIYNRALSAGEMRSVELYQGTPRGIAIA